MMVHAAEIAMSPRIKLLFYTTLITLALLILWSLLPFRIDLGYFIRVFGYIAIFIVFALGLLAIRIKK